MFKNPQLSAAAGEQASETGTETAKNTETVPPSGTESAKEDSAKSAATPPRPEAPKPRPGAKTLTNTSVADVKRNVADVVVVGNGDAFQLLCKASSKAQGWMKSCKAMEIAGAGCIVQVTTQQDDNIAEAVCFVPHVGIEDDANGGRKLVRR